MNNNNLLFVTLKTFGLLVLQSLSTLKEYVSCTFINTLLPPLHNVLKRGSLL